MPPTRTRGFSHRLTAALAVGLALGISARAADWPQWGGGPTRNAVSPEKNAADRLPAPRHVEDGKVGQPGRGVAWTGRPRRPAATSRRSSPTGSSGSAPTPAPGDDKIPAKDWDGGRADVLPRVRRQAPVDSTAPRGWAGQLHRGLPRQRRSARPRWSRATGCGTSTTARGRLPRHRPAQEGHRRPRRGVEARHAEGTRRLPAPAAHAAAFAASVAGHKDRLYVVTHNGVDEAHVNVPAPDAPSLVCLEKATGKVVWKDNSPGKNILALPDLQPARGRGRRPGAGDRRPGRRVAAELRRRRPASCSGSAT